MNDNDILRLVFLVKSCKNNLNEKYNHKFDEQVDEVCIKFCKEHKINITHGSAYKELRHKTYYYVNKNIQSIIKDGKDLYGLYENKVITDKEIVNNLLKQK